MPYEQIFYVFPMAIKSAKRTTLKKTLLMRSTDMEGQVPEFTRLNIEGLTLGPEFADGSKLLVLVNNNDAYNGKVNTKEPTHLLFFKLPAALLEKK